MYLYQDTDSLILAVTLQMGYYQAQRSAITYYHSIFKVNCLKIYGLQFYILKI